MAAFLKIPVFAGAVGSSTAAPFEAAAPARLDGVPAVVLAHGTDGRWRLRLEGRRADAFLDLAASEIAWSPDILRIRVNRASSSLVLWVRDGSALSDADGAHVVALVSETLRRIAQGRRSSPAPIESDGGLGIGLSHVLGPAKLLFGAG